MLMTGYSDADWASDTNDHHSLPEEQSVGSARSKLLDIKI